MWWPYKAAQARATLCWGHLYSFMIHDASRIQRHNPDQSWSHSSSSWLNLHPPVFLSSFAAHPAIPTQSSTAHQAASSAVPVPMGFAASFCIACCGTCCFSHPAALSTAGSEEMVSFFSWNTLIKARSTSVRLVLHSTPSILSRHTHILTVLSDTCVVILSSSIWTFEVLRPSSILVQLSGYI